MFQPNLSPLKSYAQMRALLKIASNEFEMRFVVLGGKKAVFINEKRGPGLFRVFLGMKNYPVIWGL